jgi:cell division protein FtsL
VLRLVNIFLGMTVLASAFTIYSLEHDTRRGERRIADLKRSIADEQEMMRLLEAEWSNLTRPRRLEQLANQHLTLAPISALQQVREEELPARLPIAPYDPAAASDKDPIADMLKVLE